jgi:NADH:ubiquinone oxidoreductase subunit 6 (subunit J)
VNLNDRIEFIDYISNIELLGQITYNYYCTAVLLAGLVLLVALVGAISLTQTNYKK